MAGYPCLRLLVEFFKINFYRKSVEKFRFIIQLTKTLKLATFLKFIYAPRWEEAFCQ